MKTTLLILTSFLFGTSYSQYNDEYLSRMKENLVLMDSARSQMNWQLITNNFEMIASFDTTDWLPEYYASYANLMTGMFLKDNEEKDKYCDKAMAFADKADSLKPNNDEVYLLKAFILQIQISIKPMKRGRSHGEKYNVFMAKAQTINPENPRYYMLSGENYYYTPAMFGGDKEKAKEMFMLSVDKFNAFVLKSEIHPKWGLYETKRMLRELEKKN